MTKNVHLPWRSSWSLSLRYSPAWGVSSFCFPSRRTLDAQGAARKCPVVGAPLPPRQSTLPAGFTLVELLVCIAIIAILVAIALPALAMARKVAAATQCRSSLSQFGVAFAQYRSDFRDRLPVCLTLADVRTGQVDPFASLEPYLTVAAPRTVAEAAQGGQPYRCRSDLQYGPLAGYSYFYAPTLICGSLIAEPPDAVGQVVCRIADANPRETLLRDWGLWHGRQRNLLQNDGAVLLGAPEQ